MRPTMMIMMSRMMSAAMITPMISPVLSPPAAAAGDRVLASILTGPVPVISH